ncbi:MAG: hypothetical protein IPL26_21305 [Leptospiraceae bacterium]|nr:hypothetical protein [Leptospiraceae bacterium]
MADITKTPPVESKPEGFFKTLKNIIFPKKDKDTKESYMKVYEKQSTEKAVRGTQLMLQYISTKGIKISPEIIHTLTFTKEKVETGKKLTAKEEANFWISYSDLSSAIQPVTVKSLKCVREEFGVYKGFFSKKKISFADRVQGFYRKFSLLVLVLALAMQVLWLWQNYLLHEVETNDKKLRQVIEDKYIIEKEKPANEEIKLYKINITLFELNQKLKIQKDNLQSYINPFQILMNIFKMEWLFSKESPQSKEVKIQKDTKEKETKEDNPNIVEKEIKNVNKNYYSLFEQDYMDNLQVLRFSIEILTLYLLPLAYGLLGSCTFILRVIANEIDKHIYTREHDIQFALRLLLGAFAGLVIGWFISSDAELGQGFTPTKLSPFAIAFIAGYSVELLFTMMDKIVSVYSGMEGKKEET